METSRQRRSVRLAGLAVLFFLVALTVVPTAQAQRSGGGGYAQPYAQPQLPTAAQVAQHHSYAPGPFAQLQLPTAAQVAHHQDFVPRPVAAATLTPDRAIAAAEAHSHSIHQGIGYLPGAAAAQPAASGMSATTAWIIAAAAVAGALLVGAWSMVRRRRRRGELASFCAQHPEDARCAAA